MLWGGQAASTVGTQVARLAFPLLILSLTGSAAQAGLAGAIAQIPYLVFSLLAGALVDRWNRKRVMIICDTGRTIAAASIPIALWTGHLSLVQLYAVVLIEGTLYVFFDLAETASLPRIVTREQLPLAMAQNSATFSGASLLGQPLGGALYQFGRGVPFLTDAISYLVSVISLLFIRALLQGERPQARPDLRAEIAVGLSWLWRHPLIRFLAFLNAAAWIAISGNYLTVLVVARHLHASPATIGGILAVSGVGGIIGSLAGGWLQRMLGFAPIVLATGWLLALLWPLYAIAPNLLAVTAITGAIYLVFPIYNIVQMSCRIALIPDELQGRVNSAFRLISFTGQPIGMGLAGILLQSIGIAHTALLVFGWLLLLALAVSLNPHIRQAAARAHQEPAALDR